jgi:hypothetical protein
MTAEIGFAGMMGKEFARITSLLSQAERHRCPQIPSREWEFQKTSLSSTREGGGTPKGAPW